jgi:hypothetical protein
MESSKTYLDASYDDEGARPMTLRCRRERFLGMSDMKLKDNNEEVAWANQLGLPCQDF